MIIGYIRVSTDRQAADNQRFEILKFVDEKKWTIDEWVEETVSGAIKVKERRLGSLLQKMQANDVLVATELSRIGRSSMEIMSILHDCMERNIKVFTTKERYELGNNINSKVLAFAFGLSAEIERRLISQRTIEALARKKKEGKKLGRPKGSLAKITKLTGKENEIKLLLEKKVSVSAIARILEVNRLTVRNFIVTRKLRSESIGFS
jgi:putative DNA-invertase from lambdoid prophage Rac